MKSAFRLFLSTYWTKGIRVKSVRLPMQTIKKLLSEYESASCVVENGLLTPVVEDVRLIVATAV